MENFTEEEPLFTTNIRMAPFTVASFLNAHNTEAVAG
jgi:hypothetical protein